MIPKGAVRVSLLLALAALPLAGKASGSEPADAFEWTPGPVEIRRLDYVDSLQVERDGHVAVLHLAGIDALNRKDLSLASEALESMRGWIEGGGVRLLSLRPGSGDPTRIDGFLRLFDGTLLNERLVAAGYAMIEPEGLDETETRILRLAQEQALESEKGIWALPRIRLDSMPAAREQIVTICGEVGSIRFAGDRPTEFHLGPAYPRNLLTVEVAQGPIYPPVTAPHTGREVCITGRLLEGVVVPKMLVKEPTQIRFR